MKMCGLNQSLRRNWVLPQTEVCNCALAAKRGNEQVRKMSSAALSCACREPLFVGDTSFLYRGPIAT